MRTAHGLVLAFACAACSKSELILVQPPALDASIHSILIVERRDDGLQFTARSREELESGALTLEGQISEVLFIAYEERLSSLLLRSGPVELASGSECASRSLLPAAAFFVVSPRDDQPKALPIDALPSDLLEVRLAAECPCKGFELTAHEVPGAFEVQLLFATGSGFGILGSNALIELSSGLEVTRTTTLTLTQSGYVASNGRVRMSTADGRIMERSESGEIELVLDTQTGSALDDISGAPPGFEDEAVISSSDGTVYGFDGESLFELDASGSLGSEQQAKAVWAGTGVFWASVRHSMGILSVTHSNTGDWHTENTPWPSGSDPIAELKFEVSYGVFLSTRSRRLFLLRAGATDWEEMTPATDSIRAVVPFEGGLLLAAHTGLVQHHPLSGYCEIVQFPDRRFIPHSILPTGDGTLLVGGRMEDSTQVPLYEAKPL